jgi:hypothetical protein
MFVAGWPNTKLYTCVSGVPSQVSAALPSSASLLGTTSGGTAQAVAPGNCTVSGTPPTLNCPGSGGISIQTNGSANASQSQLNFVNPATFNGLTFTWSNPSGGSETFTLGGTLSNAGLANPSFTLGSTSIALGSTITSIAGLTSLSTGIATSSVRPLVDVTSPTYGAVCNGSNDDTSALAAAAVEAGVVGGILFVPREVTCETTATVVLPFNASLEVEGTLQAKTGSTMAALVSTGDTGQVAANQFIDGFGTLDPNNIATKGIFLRNFGDYTIENVKVLEVNGAGVAIDLGDAGLPSSYGATVLNTYEQLTSAEAGTSGSVGILVDNSTDATVSGNTQIGYNIGIKDTTGDNYIISNHCWGYAANLPYDCFWNTGSASYWLNDIADTQTHAGFHFAGANDVVDKAKVVSNSSVSSTSFVGVLFDAASPNGTIRDSHFSGGGASNRMTAAYGGAGTTAPTMEGDTCIGSYVTTCNVTVGYSGPTVVTGTLTAKGAVTLGSSDGQTVQIGSGANTANALLVSGTRAELEFDSNSNAVIYSSTHNVAFAQNAVYAGIFDTSGSFGVGTSVSAASSDPFYVTSAGALHAAALSTGSAPPTACAGINGCIASGEGSTAGAPAAGVDYFRSDSSHVYKVSLNAGAEFTSLMSFSTVNLASSAAGGVTGVLPWANVAGPPTIRITVGTTAIAANSCNTVSTVANSNVATTSTFQFTPTSDVSSVTGWSPGSAGQLYFSEWPTAGNLNYYVCNHTSSSITPGASTVWNVSIQGGSTPPPTTPAVVQSVGNVVYGSSVQVTTASNITTGDTLICAVNTYSAATLVPPTGCGATFSAVGSSGGSGQQQWYSAPIAAGGACTVTAAPTGYYGTLAMACWEASNVTGVDGSPTFSSNSTSCTTGCSGVSITTATANDLVLYSALTAPGVTYSAFSPFTLDSQATSTYSSVVLAHYLLVTPGTTYPTFTQSSAASFADMEIAFK